MQRPVAAAAPQHPCRGGLPLGAPRGCCSQAGYAGAMICHEPRPELAHNAPNGSFRCHGSRAKPKGGPIQYVAIDEFRSLHEPERNMQCFERETALVRTFEVRTVITEALSPGIGFSGRLPHVQERTVMRRTRQAFLKQGTIPPVSVSPRPQQ